MMPDCVRLEGAGSSWPGVWGWGAVRFDSHGSDASRSFSWRPGRTVLGGAAGPMAKQPAPAAPPLHRRRRREKGSEGGAGERAGGERESERERESGKEREGERVGGGQGERERESGEIRPGQV
jgi:hypothetical protein